MKILSWYVVKDFLRNLAYCLAALIGLMVVANLFGNLDSIFSSWKAFQAFLDATQRSLPAAFEILLPFSVLIATVITFNSLSRTSELVAMKSAGLGMGPILKPLLVALVPIVAFAYFNQNYLHNILNRDPLVSQRALTNQWRVEGNTIFYLGEINPKNKLIRRGVLFQWHNDPFRISQILDFGQGNRGETQWELDHVVVQKKEQETWSTTRQKKTTIPTQSFPEILKSYELDAHHMPFLDLYQMISQPENRSAQVKVYLLEWFQKTAALFAPFLMVLFGAPLSQFHIRKGKVAGELIITILAGIVFWIGNEIFLIFGKSGVLPTLVAAWGANTIFLVLAIILLRRVR